MNETEKKVIVLEATQKYNTERIDKLTGVVEGLVREQTSFSRDADKRIGKLITASEVHSQQIGLLISVLKVMMGATLLAVLGAILKTVIIGG